MAQKKISRVALHKRGVIEGLPTETVDQLLSLVGPKVTGAILKLSEDQRLLSTPTPKRFIGDRMVKNLLISLLADNRDLILEWIESGETSLVDALLEILASKSTMLADLLTRYKSTILAADDEITAEMFDRLIALLRGN